MSRPAVTAGLDIPGAHAGRAGWRTFGGYMRGQLLIALFHGVSITIVLLVLRVPLAVALGVLIFLGSFIPLVGARLDAIRARLRELRERDWDAVRSRTGSASERLAAAQRYAATAHAAAGHVLAASCEAFRKAARAHERVASVHEQTAAAGVGDVSGASGRQQPTGLRPPRTGSEPNVPRRLGWRPRPGAGPARDTELCPLPHWRPPRPWVFPTV